MAMLLDMPDQFLRGIMNYFWDFSEGDKRVAHWFLMGDVMPTTYICLFYIAFCIIAPKILQVNGKKKKSNSVKTDIILILLIYFSSRVKFST